MERHDGDALERQDMGLHVGQQHSRKLLGSASAKRGATNLQVTVSVQAFAQQIHLRKDGISRGCTACMGVIDTVSYQECLKHTAQ